MPPSLALIGLFHQACFSASLEPVLNLEKGLCAAAAKELALHTVVFSRSPEQTEGRNRSKTGVQNANWVLEG